MSETPQETGENCSAEAVCPPHRVLLIAVLAISAGIATNRWLYATANDHYVGHIEVDSVTVRAPVDGILQSWEVSEGETVDPQALLCKIGGHDLERQIQQKKQEVERLSARLKTLKAEVDVKLHEHLRTVESDIYQAELQSANLLQKRYFYELEKLAWQEQREMLMDDSTTGQKLKNPRKAIAETSGSDELDDKLINAMLKEESAINSIEATDAQLEICSERLEKLEKQKEEMRNQVREAVGLSETELLLSQAEDELKHLGEMQEQQYLRATHVGVIANLKHRPGEPVKAGEALAEIFLQDETYAIAKIPTSHSHRFEVETPVKCRFPNGEIRTGIVSHVSVAASEGEMASKGSAGSTVPMRIQQTGALWPRVPIGGEITVIR